MSIQNELKMVAFISIYPVRLFFASQFMLVFNVVIRQSTTTTLFANDFFSLFWFWELLYALAGWLFHHIEDREPETERERISSEPEQTKLNKCFFLRCVRMRTDSQWETTTDAVPLVRMMRMTEESMNETMEKISTKSHLQHIPFRPSEKKSMCSESSAVPTSIHIACGFARWLILSEIKMNSEQNDVTKTTATKYIVTYNYYSSRSAHFLFFTFCRRGFFRLSLLAANAPNTSRLQWDCVFSARSSLKGHVPPFHYKANEPCRTAQHT